MMSVDVVGHVARRRRWRATNVAWALLAALLATAPVAPPTPALARVAPESFADLIEKVSPAVVQINSKQVVAMPGRGQAPLPQIPEELLRGPFRDFFERFQRDLIPGPGVPRERGSLGSGFIIDGSGVIVTNNHVIGDASEIRVTLKDGTQYSAQLVGSDDKTDIAVIRIKPDRPLPTVSWGNSDVTRVGDWVVAVGNPFGLTGTATAGIVSSRGRDLGAGPYDDFIQIDAPINSGNSGGPLFNSDGEVIGVNTAIFSPTGGNVGIGFAIPSAMAQKVVAELQQRGSVERGWLGVAIQPVTSEVAESLGLKRPAGALVASVSPNSPAEKAGLKPGDIVLAFDGRAIETVRDLTRSVADSEAGVRKDVTVWRGGREVTVKVSVGEMPRQVAASQARPAPSEPPTGGGVRLDALGLTLMPLSDGARGRFGLKSGAGAVVVEVEPGTSAAEKGLRPGDLILRVNQDGVSGPADVVDAVNRAKDASRRSVLFLVERGGEQRFVAVDLG